MASQVFQSDSGSPAAGAQSGRVGRWLLGAATALICIATLFPFNFLDTGLPVSQRVRTLDSMATLRRYPPDIAGNLLLFAPLGAAVALLLRGRGAWVGVAVATMGSLGLSAVVEALQLYLPRRDPSVRDVLCNTISGAGGAAAVVFAARFPRGMAAVRRALAWPNRPPVLLAGLGVYLLLFAVVSSRVCGPPSLANWDADSFLVLGNETDGQRPWSGAIGEIWFCDRTLDEAQWRQVTADPQAAAAGAVVHYDLREPPIVDRGGQSPRLLWRGTAPHAAQAGRGAAVGPQRWLQSETPVGPLVDGIRASGKFTVGLALRPASTMQSGPARIATICRDLTDANLTLGQEGTCLVLRVRSTLTGRGGLRPEVFVPGVFEDCRWRRVVLAGDGSRLRLWVSDPGREWSIHFPGEMGLLSRLLPVGHWAVRMSDWNGRLCRWVYQVALWGPVGLVLLLIWRRRRWQAGRSS